VCALVDKFSRQIGHGSPIPYFTIGSAPPPPSPPDVEILRMFSRYSSGVTTGCGFDSVMRFTDVMICKFSQLRSEYRVIRDSRNRRLLVIHQLEGGVVKGVRFTLYYRLFLTLQMDNLYLFLVYIPYVCNHNISNHIRYYQHIFFLV